MLRRSLIKPPASTRIPRCCVVHAEPGSAGGEGGAAPKAMDPGIAARIAAAKKYKEAGGGGVGGAGGLPSPGPPPSSPPSGAVPRTAPVDYSAMTEFLQSPPVSSGRAPSPPPSPPPLSPTSTFMRPVDSRVSIRGVMPGEDDGGIGSYEGNGGPGASSSSATNASDDPNFVPFMEREADPTLASTELAKMILNATQVWISVWGRSFIRDVDKACVWSITLPILPCAHLPSI